jgi:twitching motility protein PilT
MQSFDQSLMQHVKAGRVSYEEALLHVSNADDFALRFKGISGTSDSSWDDFDKEQADKAMEISDQQDDDLKIDRF